MRGLLICVLALLALFLVLRIGWVLPQRSVETGLDDHSGIEERYARKAVDRARIRAREWGGSVVPVTALRVTGVERCPGRPLRCGPPVREKNGVLRENPACEGSPFAVGVRLHTFFGLPCGHANLACDS